MGWLVVSQVGPNVVHSNRKLDFLVLIVLKPYTPSKSHVQKAHHWDVI